MSSRRLDLLVFLKRIWMKMLTKSHLDALTIGLQLCRSLRGVRGERTAALRLNENGSTLGNYSTQSSVSWLYSEFIPFHSDFEYMESDTRFCIVANLSLQLAKKRIRNRRTCSRRRQMGIAFFSFPFFFISLWWTVESQTTTVCCYCICIVLDYLDRGEWWS